MRPGTRREKQRRERGKTLLLSDFPPPFVPSPDSEHQNRRHTQELRLNNSQRTSVCHRWWREKNLRRKSGFATIRPPYPPPVWSLFFFLYQRSVYSLPLQILFLQYERLKLLTIAFPIRIRILNLQYFYVFEFKTGSSPYLIFQGSSFTPFFFKKKKEDGLDALVSNYPLMVTLGIFPLIYCG